MHILLQYRESAGALRAAEAQSQYDGRQQQALHSVGHTVPCPPRNSYFVNHRQTVSDAVDQAHHAEGCASQILKKQ